MAAGRSSCSRAQMLRRRLNLPSPSSRRRQTPWLPLAIQRQASAARPSRRRCCSTRPLVKSLASSSAAAPLPPCLFLCSIPCMSSLPHLVFLSSAANPAPSPWPCPSAPHRRPDRALDPRHSTAPRTDLGKPRRCTCPATVSVLPFVCFRFVLAYWVIFRSFPLHHKLNRSALASAYVFDPGGQGSNPHSHAFILRFCVSRESAFAVFYLWPSQFMS